MKDEILEKAYPEDPTAIPRYQIIAKDGATVYEGVEIRLLNNIKQPGTLFNSATMLQDEVAVNMGLNSAAVPNDVFYKLAHQRVVPLNHVRVDTRNALTGLNGLTGVITAVFKATADYSDGDTITVDGTQYSAVISTGEDLYEGIFRTGSLVSIVLDTSTKTINFKSGGGGRIPVPAPVVEGSLTVSIAGESDGKATLKIQWQNPVDENWAGTLIMRKEDSTPSDPKDGTKVFSGAGDSCTDVVEYGKLYYYRAFTYNIRKQYNLTVVDTFITPKPQVDISEMPVGAKIKDTWAGYDMVFTIVQQGNPDGLEYDVSCDGTWLMIDADASAGLWQTDKYYKDTGINLTTLPGLYNDLDGVLKPNIKQVKIPHYWIKGGNPHHDNGANGLLTHFFVPSMNELGGSGGTKAPEGTKLQYFSEAATAAVRRIYLDYFSKKPVEYVTRSTTGIYGEVRSVGTTGAFKTTYWDNRVSKAFRLCFIVNKDTKIGTAADEEGCYRPIA